MNEPICGTMLDQVRPGKHKIQAIHKPLQYFHHFMFDWAISLVNEIW